VLDDNLVVLSLALVPIYRERISLVFILIIGNAKAQKGIYQLTLFIKALTIILFLKELCFLFTKKTAFQKLQK
jgi:hypothetical protein